MAQDIKSYASVPQGGQSQVDFILLDSSGSMESKWWDSLTAIDVYVKTLREQNVNSQMMLTVFSESTELSLERDCPISDWRDFMTDPVGGFWGSTALYDAINAMGRTMRDLNPPRAAITIVTDGEENASQWTNHTQAKAILDWARAKGWQVTFIGAEFNNAKQAELLGSNPAAAIGVSQQYLTDAAKELARKRARYAIDGAPMHFTDEERQQFGGYLSAPESEVK